MKQKRSLIESFNNAIEGLIYVLRTQRNMQIEFLLAFLVLILSLFLGIQKLEFIALLFAAFFVLIAELVNTALEASIDVVATTYDPLAKIAKDVAAAAVLLSSINAIVIGIIIFHDKLNAWTVDLVKALRSPNKLYITIVSLFTVLILVIVVKTFKGQHSFLKGGWISGHSALAFSLLTAIVFATESGIVFVLGLIMALLVCQSRLETKIHTGREVLTGALMGFLVTLLIFQIFGRPIGS